MTRLVVVLALAACACGRATAAEMVDAGTVVDAGPDPYGGIVPALTDPLLRFSHKAHVLDNEIGCGVCHPNARHAPVAGLASMQTCAGCHKFVAKESPDVIRLMKAFEEGKPIEWTRVHRLPDHVYFTHERHLAKGLECAACHGEMKQRGFAVVNQPLTMGFCMDCHRAKSAPTDCLACHK